MTASTDKQAAELAGAAAAAEEAAAGEAAPEAAAEAEDVNMEEVVEGVRKAPVSALKEEIEAEAAKAE